MTAANPTADQTVALAVSECQRPFRPNLVLATTILASSLAFIDGSVVNVGLPSIGHSLRADASDLQWIIDAYLLPLGALLLCGGALGDRFGRRFILIAGVTLFGIASTACALAPSLPLFLAGRAAQGIGAALLMPNSLAILGASFDGAAKGRAIGIWAAVAAAAGAFGPVLGGWLIDAVGWRAIFVINIPVALAAIFLARMSVREIACGAPASLDLAGAGLATIGLGALTWGLTLGTGPHGWTRTAYVAVGTGAALMLAFLLVEQRRAERAMMPLSLFGSRSFVGLTLLTFLLYGAMGALLVLLPFVLIQADRYSATAAGAALLPFPLVLAVTSPWMGALAGRIGSKIPLTVGPVVVAGGFLLVTRIAPGAPYWASVLPAILVISVGMAGAVAPLTTAVLSTVDPRHTGAASGLNSAVARTAGLIATALLGSVLAATGDALVAGFHFVAACCVVVCVLAAASALMIDPWKKAKGFHPLDP
jgi:EmrB/QacA subfamily drug resistance transporter